MITIKDVKHIAKLAQMNLTGKEEEMFLKQLEDILKFINKLDELKTDGVEPTTSAVPVTNITREDLVKPSFNSEEATMNAPDKQGPFFKTPRILE